MSNLCQPHIASWCTAGSVKTQYMDSGRFSLRPNSFHLVPGQSILTAAEAIAKGDCWDAHHYWELANGGVAGGWCSTIINIGTVVAYSPGASISSYRVIRAIMTGGKTWPSTCPATNEFIGGSKECTGAEAIELIEGVDQCETQPPDFLSECHNPADGIENLVKIPRGGYDSKCMYKDCERDIACNPCDQAPEAFGGPSQYLPTTYWSLSFEYFMKEFMGVNQPDENSHKCARTITGKSSYGIVLRTANLSSLDSSSHEISRIVSDKDCGRDNCDFKINRETPQKPRHLDSPPALGAFDRPASMSDAWRDLGSHGSNRGVSWNFTSYEMRYTNIEDPNDPEYKNNPDPNCGSEDGEFWKDIVWFQDGLGRTFPECPENSPEECKIQSGLFEKDDYGKYTKPISNVTRDTPIKTYDPCWIGWTGGGKLPEEPECEDDELKNLRWVRYYDRDLENEDCPPEIEKRYESKKYGCSFDQPYDGDIIPVPGWVEPQRRVYDYWCLIANHSACLNVNLLLEGANDEPFQQLTTFFHDPAFMSSRVLNSGKGFRSWRIPPCAKNETDYSGYPMKASSDRRTFNSHDYTKDFCYLI